MGKRILRKGLIGLWILSAVSATTAWWTGLIWAAMQLAEVLP